MERCSPAGSGRCRDARDLERRPVCRVGLRRGCISAGGLGDAAEKRPVRAGGGGSGVAGASGDSPKPRPARPVYRYATLNASLRVAALAATALVASVIFQAKAEAVARPVAAGVAPWVCLVRVSPRRRQCGGVLHLARERLVAVSESLSRCLGSVSQPQQLRAVSGTGASGEPVAGLHGGSQRARQPLPGNERNDARLRAGLGIPGGRGAADSRNRRRCSHSPGRWLRGG